MGAVAMAARSVCLAERHAVVTVSLKDAQQGERSVPQAALHETAIAAYALILQPILHRFVRQQTPGIHPRIPAELQTILLQS